MANDDTDRTLHEDDVKPQKRHVGRRRALSLLGQGSALGAIALTAGASGGCVTRRVRGARTVVVSGVTDSDGGPYADPGGNGRGHTGITDSDGGRWADPVGRGRGGRRVAGTGITDSDGGRYADPVGHGRGGGGGITDSDGGPCADPAGAGRGYSGVTDSDGGMCADPVGRGRY